MILGMSTATYTLLHVLISLVGIASPTQKEPPFVAAQILVLLMFATLTVLATVRFHPERVSAA